MLQNKTTNALLDTQLITNLLAKNGPDPEDYGTLKKWYQKVYQLFQTKQISKEEFLELKSLFGEVYASPNSLLGHANNQPRGYAGDFEFIEKIYTHHISSDSRFEKWDLFIQSISISKVGRNRKTYFKNLLKSKSTNSFRTLNLASGPCRDLLEFFEENPNLKTQIDCVEMDKDAINFATQLLGSHIDKVHFFLENIFKFQTDEIYDLVWSAGLFDYFDDITFIRIFAQFYQNLKNGGEIIIGNIHPRSPSRPIMEFTNWHLHHRTETDLVELAIQAGVTDYSKIRIEMEPEGVNLFLRVRK